MASCLAQARLISESGYRPIGFIDLVFQWQDRFYIVDYKSTYLGDQFEYYQHSYLEQNVSDNFYDLQYLIYSLALHRYLKHKKTDYDPQRHFGGIYYLYLRGMAPNSHTGVFQADISLSILNKLDSLFANSALTETVYV